MTYSYQLAAVNTGIIDPKCDNLYVGEVRPQDTMYTKT